ncbi:MAG TPA: fibronectin type III domain-containing protein [Hymenobacter sp.]
MTNHYALKTTIRRFRQLGLTALLIGGTAVVAQAQSLNYSAAGATNVTGTYTDLGTTGAAIATANTDDANSAAQSIGFTFSYNGVSFTQFVLNTNGAIRLGSAAPSTAALYYNADENGTGTDPLAGNNPADVNLLLPFNIDLVPGSGAGGAEYRVLTSGTAPNRVCTIQWKNVADKAGTGTDIANVTQYANISFQLKLYETSGNIEFVYDQAVAGTGAAGVRLPQVGLKGSGVAAGQVTLALKANPAAAWSTTTFQNTNYTTNTHNITKTAGPDAGRTYRFTPIPPLANDVAVRAVYTLGKIATPSALPQAVRAFIANAGTAPRTNVAVTLSITGANTFTNTVTVPTLPVGAQGTITFADLPATLTAGTNTVTVSVVADEDNTNNSVTVSQLVTPNRLSYIEPGKPNDGAVFFSNTSAGAVLSAKYTVPGTVALANASITFAAAPSNPTTAFQVVVYDATSAGTPGNLIYASTPQNRPAGGGDVTVTLPPLQATGAFHVGVKEVGTTGSYIATQTETPLRASTFYISATGAAPWTDLAPTTFQRRFAIEVELLPAPTCVAPTNLAITGTTATTAVASFTAASNVGGYELIYGPTGFQPATGGTTVTASASPFTLTGLQPGTNYQVYVRSNCTGGGKSFLAGPVNFSTICNTVTTVTAFPYNEGFDNILTGQALPCGIKIIDANGDGTTWAVTRTTPNSGTSAIRYNAITLNNVAANDWFFTPALVLAANTRYQVAFRYRGEGIANSPSSFTESLEVKSGAEATAAAQTNLLYTNAAITNTSYALANGTSTPVVALLPAGAGTQYVGFHVKSAANQGALYIDDIVVAPVVASATSEALMRAVSVFPNPSTTGLFDLEIHGARANGPLEVLVTNALGQRVHKGAARDNYTNKLDLSGLAPGIYTLRLRNGEEYMTSRISIVK